MSDVVLLLGFEVSICVGHILRQVFGLNLDLFFVLFIIELVHLTLFVKFLISCGILDFFHLFLRIEDFLEHLLLLSLG